MKKLIATLTAIAAAMTMCVFAEKYVSANDLELGTITADKALEDDFTIKATEEKSVEISKHSSENPNTIPTGEVFTQRIKLGGSGSVDARSIGFPAKAGQKVTIYGLSSSKTDSRVIAVFAADGTQVGGVNVEPYSASAISSGTVTIPADGNYFVGSKKSGVWVFEIVVE